MSNFTPGPWLVSSSTLVVTDKAEIIANTIPTFVAGLQLPMKESEANAHLIAAAPELLEACEKLVEVAPVLWGSDHDEWPRIMDRIEAAIAKATE